MSGAPEGLGGFGMRFGEGFAYVQASVRWHVDQGPAGDCVPVPKPYGLDHALSTGLGVTDANAKHFLEPSVLGNSFVLPR